MSASPAIIREQVRSQIESLDRQKWTLERARVYAVGCAVYNHGLLAAREALGLKAPRIRSIFYRFDAFERCQLAARQMLAKGGPRL